MIVEFVMVGQIKDGKIYYRLWSVDEIDVLFKKYDLVKDEIKEE